MESIIYLKSSEFFPNPRQPRKHFDEAAMKELTASIRSVGVLQPITVRQVEGKPGYEIVCGERRWRAAKAAKLDTVPAIVRQLSDDEAMDVAITENLQRKDIDPFEEAAAFQYLLEKGQSFDDLAARFGKSSVFVRGRVKLNDLIEPLRLLYEAKEIPVSHCLEICKFSNDIQTRIYDDRYKTSVPNYNSWRDSTLRVVRTGLELYMQALKSAPFDKTECETCPKNTAVCGLFDEMREVSCSDKECYKRKTIEHRTAKIIQKHEANPDLVLYAHYASGDINDQVFTRVKAEGVPYHTTGFMQVPGTEKPQKQKDQSEQEYAAAMAAYQEQTAEVAKKIDSGEYRQAMRIDDMEFGKIVVVQPVGSNTVDKPAAPESTVNDLRQKDRRNQELRIENTFAEITNLYHDKKAEFPDENTPLSELEIALMYYHMAPWEIKNSLYKGWEPVPENIIRILNMTAAERIQAVRHFLRTSIPYLSHEAMNGVYIELYKQYFPADAEAIEQKHRETYLRRKKKIDARIAEIEGGDEPTKQKSPKNN